MNSYAKYIETVIEQEPENKLLEASILYQKSFGTVPEMTYYKTLERMSKRGSLVHLTKGLYYRPKKSRFGTIPISENILKLSCKNKTPRTMLVTGSKAVSIEAFELPISRIPICRNTVARMPPSMANSRIIRSIYLTGILKRSLFNTPRMPNTGVIHSTRNNASITSPTP